MSLSLRSALFVALIAVAGTWLGPSQAGGRDHDAVRQAVKRGDIRPLTDILAAIRDKLPGEVAGVEIERNDGHWIYEFRVVDDKGRIFEVRVDARTAEIEQIKEK